MTPNGGRPLSLNQYYWQWSSVLWKAKSSLTAAAILGNLLVNLCPFHRPHLGRLSQENSRDPGNPSLLPYLPRRGWLPLATNRTPLHISLHSFPPHRKTVVHQIWEQILGGGKNSITLYPYHEASLVAQMVKNLPTMRVDLCSIQGSGRSLREENSYPI